MRRALLLSIALVATSSFGCKKASTPDPVDEDAAVATASDTGAPGDDVGAAEGETGSGAAGEGAGAAGAGGGTGEASSGEAGSGAADDAGGAPGGDGGANDAATGPEDSATAPTAAASGKPGDPNPTAPGAPAGNVDFVVQSAAGGTTAETLNAALLKAKQRFRGCYGKALASDPGTSGVLKLRATISGEGVVEKVDVIGGTLSPSPLVQCTVATTKSMKVPAAAPPQTKASFDVKFSK